MKQTSGTRLGAFLGASYFRLLGKGQRYGPSARGLALDCGEPDRPEEFPIFTDWWLGKPQKDDTAIDACSPFSTASVARARMNSSSTPAKRRWWT